MNLNMIKCKETAAAAAADDDAEEMLSHVQKFDIEEEKNCDLQKKTDEF